MRALNTNPNVDNSDLSNYPDGRIKNNTGTGNGTPVNEKVYGDLHQTIAKLLRLYGITPNNLPDNENNGFQIVDAIAALASKNDFILPITLNAGVMSIPIKLGFMKDGEQVFCQVGFGYDGESEIKGSDATTFSVTAIGNFQPNEHVMLKKTSSGVELIRMADHISMNAMIEELFYLKKASQSQENSGTEDTVATTPLVNKVAFTKRVNGTDSPSYLANATRNGIYPKEHFSIVEGLNKLRNTGFFSGLDVGSLSGTLSIGGDITAATIFTVVGQGSGNSFVLVTMDNPMDNTNYVVKSYVQSEGNILADKNICAPVFVPVSTTQFKMAFQEITGGAQSLKVHLEVVQL